MALKDNPDKAQKLEDNNKGLEAEGNPKKALKLEDKLEED